MISSDTALMSGMSCSMITIEHCVARCMSFSRGPRASVSRWATPDDGSSRSSTRRVVGDGHGQVDDAPHAGGELGDELVPIGLEVHQLDELRHPPGDLTLGLLDRRQVEQCRQMVPRGDVPFETHGDVLRDGEGREDASVLEGPPQAGHRPAAGRPGADVDAAQLDPTAVDGEHPGDEVEDRCLARPVGADQPQRLTTTQVERDIVDGEDPAEAFGEAAGGEDDGLRRQWIGSAVPATSGR